MSPVPTLQEVFGTKDVFVTDPAPAVLGPNGKIIPCNNLYFATKAAAAIVAQLLGGVVEETYANVSRPGPFFQNQPNLMVRMPALPGEDTGRLINAGYICTLFENGYTKEYIEMCIGVETGTAFHFPA